MSWQDILKIDITMNWQDVIKTSLQDLFNQLSTSQKQEVNNHIKAGLTGQKAIEIIQMKYGLGSFKGKYENKPQPPESAWREKTY